ncbi:unnamed protein product, partial [Amoebophrya sp. A25]|eukprot:GSA25T00017015001.1
MNLRLATCIHEAAEANVDAHMVAGDKVVVPGEELSSAGKSIRAKNKESGSVGDGD